MYCSVPPPGSPAQQDACQHTHKAPDDRGATHGGEVTGPQPANISQQQWERFQKLRSRRKEVCSKSGKQRVKAMRNKALHKVSREFTELDKQVLIEEGVSLPEPTTGKRKCYMSTTASPCGPSPSPCDPSPSPCDPSSSKRTEDLATSWGEVKRYLNPNPQLSSRCPDATATHKSGLDKALDVAMETGDLDKAATISDNIATREFASKIATAFDCVEYVKRKKMERERKKKGKLKWSFEQKKRWETKGNM